MKMPQERVFVGIDVAKDHLDVAVIPSAEAFRLANDQEGRAELVRRLRRLRPEAVGLEASGGYERAVLKAMLKADLPARRLNPFRVQRRRSSDYLLVGATLLVIIALVAWALL